jgi:hypothetical protein
MYRLHTNRLLIWSQLVDMSLNMHAALRGANVHAVLGVSSEMWSDGCTDVVLFSALQSVLYGTPHAIIVLRYPTSYHKR